MNLARLLQRARLLPKNTQAFHLSISSPSSCRQFFSNPSSVSSKTLDIYNYNLRISALGRSGEVSKARELFDKMPKRDVVTYASMVSIYLKDGNLPQAENLFWAMPERNVIVESAMIDGYAKAGRIEDARILFEGMPVRNVYTWTSLVSGYCRVGKVDEARRIFDQMLERNVVSWTTMLLGYAQNGMISDARELFDRMPEKNVISWTSMIKGYVDSGRVGEARKLFDEMPHRNVYSWNVMILGYLGSNQAEKATELFWLMPSRNMVSWTTMVTGLAENGLIEKAQEFFNQMPERDIAAWNAMITAYIDKGRISEAGELFSSMPAKNVVTWNAMIDGYVKNGFQGEALGLFLLMLHSLMKYNEATLTSVLVACECILEIMQIHALALKLGFESNTSLTNTLITMYSKNGDLTSACVAFEGLATKDVVSWTSMILAYSNHGCGDPALQAFARMLKHGEKPDEVTFVGVLSACSHAGLVEKGRLIFDAMSHVYSIEPKAEHYSCLVDLLGRGGCVKEAELVVSMVPPSKCDEAVLGALLGACRVHNEIKVACHVGEKLMQLEPASSGGYVLLANAYAWHGKWNDVARVRKMMKERKVKKEPGYSRIEVKMRSNWFCIGDRSHPETKEIYEMLEEVLLPQMKDMRCLHELLGFT